MKKKLLALLLAALMIVSIFPVSAFSEGPVPEEKQTEEIANEIAVQQDPTVAAANALLASGEMPQPEPTDPDEVHDALDAAVGSATEAAGNFAPLSQNQLDEAAAAGFDAAADQHLEDAEDVTGFSDGFTGVLADIGEGHADNAAQDAQDAADKARADAEKAQRIADEFPAKLAAAIARYAWSLKGDGYANLINDESKLTGKDFVDHVYSHFGFKLNLDGSVAAIGGYQVNAANRAPGDVIAVTGADGSVTGFGVNYGLDGLDGVVQLDEASGEVVMTAPADLGSFAAVRVV